MYALVTFLITIIEEYKISQNSFALIVCKIYKCKL